MNECISLYRNIMKDFSASTYVDYRYDSSLSHAVVIYRYVIVVLLVSFIQICFVKLILER